VAGQKDGKPPFVKLVTHEREAKENIPFKIQLEADWPTPSWIHQNTQVEINKEKSEMIIWYLGTRRPGVALQEVKDFTVELSVEFPNKGLWKLTVMGKNENWESQITVI